MDVTEQIQRFSILYGASDNTNPAGIAAAKKLNYAEGASITKPSLETVALIPSRLKYEDAVGLFGVENHFVKVDLRLLNPTSICYPENTYICAIFRDEEIDPADPYTYFNTGTTPGQAYIDEFADETDDGSCPEFDVCYKNYQPSNLIGNEVPSYGSPKVSVRLNNLKTGNQYIDDWLDTRLYTKDRMEHPYNLMYINPGDFFYIGFHARNTKRLPYNVEVIVGEQYLDQSEIEDPRFIARLIR